MKTSLRKTYSNFLKTKSFYFCTNKEIPTVPPSDPKYGNLLDVGKMGGFHTFLTKYHKELGDVFYFYVMKDRCVSLGHPKYWRVVSHLSEKSDHVRMFLKPLFGTAKTVNLANGMDRATRYQKYINPVVNKEAVEKMHSKVVASHLNEIVDQFSEYAQKKEKVPVQEKFCLFVIANMLDILFGNRNTSKEEMLKLFDYLTYCVVNVEVKTLNVQMDEATEKEIKEKITYVHNFIKSNILNRMKENVEEKTCLVDWLKTENNEDVVFTDGMTFFFGSIHTTISNLTFCVYHLAKNEDKQRKLQAEIDTKLGDKEINANTIKELKYLRACINEALRLTPPVSTSSRIDNENDITLPDGMVIPKKTPIITPLGLVLLHEDLWRNPQEFIPERFKEDGVQFANQFSPFGFAGGRVCPGKALAQLEIQFMIASIFRKFNVTLAQGQGPLNLHYLTGTTTKEEIYVDLTPRHQFI